MKKFIVVIVIVGIIGIPLEATSTKVKYDFRYLSVVKIVTTVTIDALTVYNPTVDQCDSSPLITASNSAIDTIALREQEVRWLALSRDLIHRWGGVFHYGDTVYVVAKDPAIDGVWIVKDTMNKRYRSHGDLLFHSDVRTKGKWSNVDVFKISVAQLETRL